MKGGEPMGRRRFCVMIMILLLILLLPLQAGAAGNSDTPLTDFEYTLQPDGRVLLTKYTGSSQRVTVPDAYTVEGVNRPVVLASKGVFVKNSTVTDITLRPGVKFYNNSMSYLFVECSELRTVRMAGVDTSTVTDMSYMFYGCEKLHTIEGYEAWDTRSLKTIFYMFCYTSSLKKVDLSRWDLSALMNSGWCFQKCGAHTILLPDNLAVISAGFLNHADDWYGSTFTVPAGVKQIGYAHTMYDFGTQSFTQFQVAEGNSGYKSVDGILYSADGKQMLAIPRAKVFEENTYVIPEGVEFMGELSFSRNYNVRKVILPDSYRLAYIPLRDPDYILYEDIGNINAGLNLHLAIYRYTGVTEYEVKPSNPNYQSRDGVIYSKDMTRLLAVPTGYAQKLQIPEGVTRWEKDAMWAVDEVLTVHMQNCSGVSIPSTVLFIADDQMAKLNALNKKYGGFAISVSQDNPFYYVDDSGNLGKRPQLQDMEISLSESITVYDGAAKMPIPTVKYQGQLLQEGQDYTLEYRDNVNAGTGRITITAKGVLNGVVECTFVIAPATPTYETPPPLQAVYGQLQGELSLPEGFSWMDPEATVGNTGSNICQAMYTSSDPNYGTVENIPVTVTVTPRELSSDAITVRQLHFWLGAVTPKPAVVYNGNTVPETEYTVSYSSNGFYGKGELTVTDNPGGNYTVEGTASFWIIPGPVYLIGVLILLWYLTLGRKEKINAQSKRQQKIR